MDCIIFVHCSGLLLSHSVKFDSLWPMDCRKQASLFFTISWSFLKLMSIESVMPPNHLVPCHPLLLLPSIFSRSFPMSQPFTSGGQNIGASTSASVLSMNSQDWFRLGLTGLISLWFKGLSRVFSDTTAQKHKIFSAQPSLWSNSLIHTWLLKKP